ncbi:MAG: YdhR family protein [Candidatus Bathyarchaeota archaeon]|nr:YdhR family protein [Candidatus Bathyarchaeota archaeon]
MELLIFLFKSELHNEEILATMEKRSDRYLKVKGLIQKYYVEDKSTGHIGGVFLFDSKENLKVFRDSELAKSTGEAYKFVEPPIIRLLEVAKLLRT